MNNSMVFRALRLLQHSAYAPCRSTVRTPPLNALRAFSSSTPSFAANNKSQQPLDSVLQHVDQSWKRASPYDSLIPDGGPELQNLVPKEWPEDDRHHLHIYAHKHNTLLTLTRPNRDPLISVSCGNIGFRKSGRGSYDAAYQLAAFCMSRIQDKGLLPKIQKLELVYRGFGPGRDAVTKAILGTEGRKIRPLIVRLSDSTRLKFGGTRSRKPRRLG